MSRIEGIHIRSSEAVAASLAVSIACLTQSSGVDGGPVGAGDDRLAKA